jgi:Putative beta-barrel porin 2
MHRLILTKGLAAMSQALVDCGKTVSKRLLTVFSLVLFATSFSSTAKSDAMISSGISGDEQLLPFASLKVKNQWAFSSWDLSTLVDVRSQFDEGIGDAHAKMEWHGDTELDPQTKLELDAAYGFVREHTEVTKQFHVFRGDIGLERKFENFKIKADIGAEVRRFEDTTQKGYLPLDRGAENLVDNETAVRVTLFHEAWLQPFVEAAFVERDYFKSPVRGFSGPELIGGVTFAYPKLSGDFAVEISSRDTYDGRNVAVIGPYVDLKWQVRSGSEFSLGLGAGIEQDTSGLQDMYPYYSGRLEVLQDVTEDLKLSLLLDAIVECRETGSETELSPSFKLTWNQDNGIGIFSSAGMTYTKIHNLNAALEPSFEVGIQWVF